MKKIWILLFAGLICVSLAACGKSETAATGSGSAESELPYIYGEKTNENGRFTVSVGTFVKTYEDIFNQFMQRVDEIDRVTLTQNSGEPAQYDLSFDGEEPTVRLVFSTGEKKVKAPEDSFDTIVIYSDGRRIDDDQPFAYAMYMMLLTNNNKQSVETVTKNLDHLYKTAKTGFKTKKESTLTIDGLDCTLDSTYQNLSFTITNHKENQEISDASEAINL